MAPFSNSHALCSPTESLSAAACPCHQVIAFFVTARLTQFYSEFFDAMGLPVLEIHSRKSQSARTKASDAFRAGSRVRTHPVAISKRTGRTPGGHGSS